MSLLDIQRQFCAFLIDAPSRIANHTGPDGEAGLAVYHHAYRAQLADSLRDSYERVWAWLGDDAFAQAAQAYIAAHRPRSWTISDYGAGFPALLAERHPDAPEVGELAALDWALRRAFDSPDTPPIEARALADVDWERARLRFVPSLRVLPAHSNAAAIWKALAEDGMPPPAARLPAPGAIRVWRQQLVPRFQSMDALERRALALCLDGAGFASLCEALAADGDAAQAAADAGRLLAEWLRDGLLAAIDED